MVCAIQALATMPAFLHLYNDRIITPETEIAENKSR